MDAVSVYLDASVLVAFFTSDPFTDRAEAFLQADLPAVVVSDFAAAEFASVLARRVRTGELTPKGARSTFAAFDTWVARTVDVLETTTADIATATSYVRRLDLTLRTPDAINIALAQRANASLATFDKTMVSCAKTLRCPVAAL